MQFRTKYAIYVFDDKSVDKGFMHVQHCEVVKKAMKAEELCKGWYGPFSGKNAMFDAMDAVAKDELDGCRECLPAISSFGRM